MWLLIAFIAVPLIEIGLFIQVGGLIGLWPTLAIVLMTAIAGTWLVRSQGLQELANLQSSLAELRDPTEPLAHGAMIIFAGALLLTPGFFTDAIGLSFLIPPVRTAVYKWLRSKVKVETFATGAPSRPNRADQDDAVIDGEYEEVSPPKSPTHPPSGWTRH